MKKVLEIMTIVSFAVSVGVVGTAGYVVIRKDAIIDDIKEKVMGGVTDLLPGAIGDQVPSIPEVPSMTGPALFGK
jgi:hypothetical protein|tara:strand:+ start:726 stop:950 length:225 start_codon:yes stop_codon:yes gene_type:complete